MSELKSKCRQAKQIILEVAQELNLSMGISDEIDPENFSELSDDLELARRSITAAIDLIEIEVSENAQRNAVYH